MHAWLYLPADKSMAAPGTAKVPVVIMAHGYGLDKVRASRGPSGRQDCHHGLLACLSCSRLSIPV